MTSPELVAAIEKAARTLPRDQVFRLAEVLEHVANPGPRTRYELSEIAPTPSFRTLASALAEAWLSDGAKVSGLGLSIALRACVDAVTAERDAESIETVWTGPRTTEVPVRLTSSVLVDVIHSAQEGLIIVSFAAYKVDVILDALEAAAARGVKVRIILESDQAGGGTLTFAARPAFAALKDSVAFYVWPTAKRPELEKGRASLHAKAAIADEHTALVTSANLTGHAIAQNMELGLLVRGGPVPRRLSRHFVQLIHDGVLEQQL